MKALTPYDTGERLEPKLWQPDRRDHDTYGKVDFENDESATELTLYVQRDGAGGYVVRGYRHGDIPVRLELDDDHTSPLLVAIADALEDRGATAAAELVRDTDPADDLWNNYVGPMLDELQADYTTISAELAAEAELDVDQRPCLDAGEHQRTARHGKSTCPTNQGETDGH